MRFLLALLLSASVFAQGATTVTGRLLDEDGAPIVGARVELDSRSGADGTWKDVDAKSDVDGRFHLRCGLIEGQVIELVVSRRGLAGLRRTIRDQQPGTVFDLGDLEVLPAGSVAGRIIDGAGNTVAARGWQITGRYGPGRGFGASATIDAQTGEFRFSSLPDGPIAISARYGFDLQTEEVEAVVASARETYVELPYQGPDPARRVTVRLRAPRGVSIHGQDLVQLLDEEGRVQQGALGDFSRDTLYDGLEPGTYTAIVEDPRFVRVEQEAELGGRTDITLVGAAAVKVEVVDQETGEPIENYALDVVYPDSNVSPNRQELFGVGDAKPKGGVVTGIVPGAVAFVARTPGRPDASLALDRLQAGEPAPVRIEVSTAQELRGRLLGPDGEPETLEVVVEWTPGTEAGHTTGGTMRMNGREVPAVRKAIRVPPSGQFQLEGAGPGAHLLRVRWSEWLSRDVLVHLPLEEPLTIERPPCGWVTGTLEAPLGLDPAKVELVFVEAQGRSRGGITSFGGSQASQYPRPKGFEAGGRAFRVGPFPAGRFFVHGRMAPSGASAGSMHHRHYYDEDAALAEVKVAIDETSELVVDVSTVFPSEAEVSIDAGGVEHGKIDVIMRSRRSTTHGGTTVFTGLQAGERYQVTLSCEPQGWSYEGHTYFTALPGKRRQLRVEVPLVQRRVRFEDGDGALLADTEVAWGCGMLAQTGRTDAGGHLDLTLIAGPVSFGRKLPDLVDLTWAAGDGALVVRLPEY